MLLLKCFNCMDAFAECVLLRLPFLKAICFSKQTAKLILIYLSTLGTPTLSHRRDKKTRIRVSCETLSSSFAVLCFLSLDVTHLRALFHGLTLDLLNPVTASCQGRRTLCLQVQNAQGLRKSITSHWFGSSMFHLSMLLRSRAKGGTRKTTER